ncbi:hypothetical protein ACFSQ7_34910 [Paenibacillus rhizoplanae]
MDSFADAAGPAAVHFLRTALGRTDEKNQRLLVVITFVLFIIGILGVWLGRTELMALWAICIGIGGGFAFGLAMMFFSLRTRTVQEASELSGMAQSAGYLLAAAGPALFGLLHDAAGSWNAPLALLAGACVLLFVAGMGGGTRQICGRPVVNEGPRQLDGAHYTFV